MSVTVRILSGSQRGVSRLDMSSGTVADVLAELGLSPQAYLAAIDDEMVPIDTEVQDGDEIALVRAVAGG